MITELCVIPPAPLRTPLYGSPIKRRAIKMTIRDLTYRLFLFRGGESLTFTLRKYCCGDERRTCVLRKRLITLLSCVYPCAFAATDCLRHFVRLIPPRHVFIDSSQTSKYDTLFPLFSLVQPWMTGEFLNSITLLFCFSVTSASKTVCKYIVAFFSSNFVYEILSSDEVS